MPLLFETMTMEYLYHFLDSFVPESINDMFRQKLRYGGIKEDVGVWLGRVIFLTASMFILGWIIPLAIYLNKQLLSQLLTVTGIRNVLNFLISNGWLPNIFFPFRRDLLFAIAFGSVPLSLLLGIGTFFVAYLYLFYRIEDRTDRIEKFLPDFLYVMVSNLEAGMTPFGAFVASARPEFGPLEEGVKFAAAKVSSTKSITFAMKELCNTIDSASFRRVVDFFEKGIRTGGKVAHLLSASADEMKRVKTMENEVAVEVRGYIVFLAFIIIFIAPFLFAVGNEFLATFVKIKKEIPNMSSVQGSLPITMFSGKVELSVAQLHFVIVCFLAFDCFLISLFIGALQKGKLLYGAKYFPFLFGATLFVFFIADTTIKSMFSMAT